MGHVVEITDNEPHKASEVICVHCGKRWWAVRHINTRLAALECPECTNQGYVIETGETIKEEE